MKPISLAGLYHEWQLKNEKVASYRLGQHFINRCICDSSPRRFQVLWNIEDPVLALGAIQSICQEYQWDVTNMPTIREV